MTKITDLNPIYQYFINIEQILAILGKIYSSICAVHLLYQNNYLLWKTNQWYQQWHQTPMPIRTFQEILPLPKAVQQV
jgi:hypothetical protein